MPTLTTYLGHSNISDTYWYLSAFVRSGARSILRVPATAFIPEALRRREHVVPEHEPGEAPEEIGS